MSTISRSVSTDTKDSPTGKLEKGGARTTVLPAAIAEDEKDVDEAQAIAGDLRHAITQEEDDAIRRKVDRRVIPILAAVYFSQVS